MLFRALAFLRLFEAPKDFSNKVTDLSKTLIVFEASKRSRRLASAPAVMATLRSSSTDPEMDTSDPPDVLFFPEVEVKFPPAEVELFNDVELEPTRLVEL